MIKINKTKAVVFGAVAAAVLGLVIALCVLVSKNKKLQSDYEVLASNHSAAVAGLASSSAEARVWKLTVDDLRALSDSSSAALDRLQRRLKVKDNQIKSLQNMQTEFTRTDTIILKDTIFRDLEFCLDTVIGDEWMSTALHMEWPSTVSVQPVAVSDKNVLIYVEKETVHAPKKCWLARLFQKKQKVVKVYVDEKNPHITTQKNEFTEIIK